MLLLESLSNETIKIFVAISFNMRRARTDSIFLLSMQNNSSKKRHRVSFKISTITIGELYLDRANVRYNLYFSSIL